MTDEEMQKKIEFIIATQAQFAVNLDLLREAQQRTEVNVAGIAAAQSQTARAQTYVLEVVTALAEAQQRTEIKIAELAEAQKHTDEALVETNERLNNLIIVVERYISEGRNGRSKG
jgi:uncharacterized protein YyaL (SSP411 family)